MNWLQQVFYIKDGTDYNQTAIAISDGIKVKGLNVWLMICSALLASIGLDTNSTAVIIGAMLISPLMSPILGAGYSVAVHDKELFIRSANNLVYITIFSLLTSVIYFVLTPLGDVTAEIMARTQPTVLDIGVAFFGGVAGIVSASRREKINAIPGVAIATALMPPLCSAGYGLASGRWEIFGGAFYLFFINAVFIALSTYLIVKLLRFPIKTYVDKTKQKRVSRLALMMIILVSVPSFWFLYSVYQKNKIRQLIQNEVINSFHTKGNEILKWEVEKTDSIYFIKTFFSGGQVSDSVRFYYNYKLQQLGMNNYQVRFIRMNMSRSEMEKMNSAMAESILKNVEMQNSRLKDSLQQDIASFDREKLYRELRSLYPNINRVGVTQLELSLSSGKDTVWTAYLLWDSLSRQFNKTEASEVLQRFLQTKLNTDTIWLIQEQQVKKE